MRSSLEVEQRWGMSWEQGCGMSNGTGRALAEQWRGQGHKGRSRHSEVIGQARARGVDAQSKGISRVTGTGRARAWAESGQAESGHEARARGRANNGVGRGQSIYAAQGQEGGQNKGRAREEMVALQNGDNPLLQVVENYFHQI